MVNLGRREGDEVEAGGGVEEGAEKVDLVAIGLRSCVHWLLRPISRFARYLRRRQPVFAQWGGGDAGGLNAGHEKRWPALPEGLDGGDAGGSEGGDGGGEQNYQQES